MSKHKPVINPLECKGCGRCIEACPKQLLHMSDEFNARGYRFSVYKGDGCIGCGLCFYVCPEPYALRVEETETEKGQGQPSKGEQ